MKFINTLLFLILTFLQTNAQCLGGQLGGFTQSLNCYNDSAGIFTTSNPLVTIMSIDQWQFKPFSQLGSTSYMDIDTMNFLSLSANKDTLWTKRCGSFRVFHTFDDGNTISSGCSEFIIGCKLTIGQGQDDILCNGDSSGVLKRPVFGGDPFLDNAVPYYLFQWIFAEDSLGTNSFYYLDTIDILQNVSAGWYKTIVTDSLNCSDTIGFIEFKDPAIIDIDTISVQPVLCRGTSSAAISLQISGGNKYNLNNKYFYYLLLNGDTIGFSDTIGASNNFTHLSPSNINMQVFYKDSIKFDSLSSGEYFFHVIDSNSCLMVDTFLIEELPEIEAFSSTNQQLICNSDSSYLFIDSINFIDNSIYGFGYNLIEGIHMDSIYVSSGTYPIYIQDTINECIDTAFVTCTSQSDILIYETITNINCYGDTTGKVLIDSIVGGIQPYDIYWGNINNLALSSGTYQLNVIDSIGCVQKKIYTITENDIISCDSEKYNPSCFGMSDGSIAINLFGGVGDLNYYWLHSLSSNDSIFGLISNTYSLIVTDSLNCMDTFDIFLNEPDSLLIDPGDYQSHLNCFGILTPVNPLILGGTPPYNILWNDADTNQSRVLTANSYSVSVNDKNGCLSFNNQIIINQPDSLVIDIYATENSCFDDATATVFVQGGSGDISFLWSTGDTTQTIDSLSSSIYWVVVTDSCGSSVSDTVYVDDYSLTTNVYYIDSIHAATVEVLNSTSIGPFNYYWQDSTGDTISQGIYSEPLCEGNFYVTTVDLSNGCSVFDTLNVEFFLPLYTLLDISNTTVLDDIELWGGEPYTYLWDNGSIAQHADICPGEHWVEVTDQFNCTLREDFEIPEYIVSLDPPSVLVECNIENLDVELEAIVSGATEPYSFDWSNGLTDNPVNIGLSPGNLDLTITDANGCIKDTSLTILSITEECVPNIFSPNGDNINDTWNLEDTFLFSDSKVKVF